MKNQCRQTIDLSLEGEDWQRYLKGETLKGTEQFKGWVLMTINGFPLGWGKESNGIVKNLYPKGLRMM
jgi:NOL1/NOP2/fmu family ribosome biogenesis protein